MLKWLKTITNRLFGEDEDVYDEKKENNQLTETEVEVERTTETFEEKPVFRFPIITDAEIYGWDDEEPKEKKVSLSNEKNEQKDEDYQPIPLYENDRWPTKDVPVKIYKANDQLPINRQHEKTHDSVDLDRESKFEKVVKKSPGSRFVPSDVPSPIYGYVNRDELVENKSSDATELKKKIKLPAEEFILQPILEEQPALEQSIQSNEFHLEKELEHYDEEAFVEEPTVEIENLTHENDLVESTEETEPTESTEPTEPTAPIIDEHHGPVVEKVTIPEEVTRVVERHEDSPFIDEEPVEQEKIIPFNVVMLKSDKEKLAQREAMAIMPEPIIPIPKQPVQEVAVTKEVEVEVEVTESISTDVVEEVEHYVLPALDYLIPPEYQVEDTEWLAMQSEKLEESLSHFGVTATVIDAVQGPTVTRFEFTVGQGTKVSRVRNLADDLKLTLAARDIRIQAPIPGKSSIGIEIPNRQTRPVRISEVIQTEAFQQSDSPLEAVLGLGLTGEPVTLDLREMPHGLIAGATGSGKSVCINSILISLLYKASPADLKMLLIDPKMVELAPFNGIPHLLSPVITDVKAATAALKWAVNEMERRYELLAHAGVRDIERYNKAAVESRQFALKMPYLLIVIDELADLMMMAPADVEVSISRIAQKARACGIHLIIATQRPSVDVITGTIKANIPTRIAFSVSSQVDSRTMIDTNGAERLLGRGDMLYIGNGESTPVRLQGTFVTDDEIERIIKHVQQEASPTYLFGQDDLLKSAVEEDEDPLFAEACLFVYQQNSASTSMLQRNFSIGYNRAAKLMDRMEKHGFISAQQGSKARDVYMTESELNQLTDSTF